MPPSVSRPRLVQPTLFHPLPSRPSFRTLPPDIQEKTIRLLARLLRRRAVRRLASGPSREGCDE
jgi:hypothetical protein